MASIGDQLDREWHEARDTLRRLTHPHHHDAPQPAAAPPIPHNDNQEATPMSFLTAIEAKAKSLAADFETVDHEALNILEAVTSNPATAEGYQILGQLTHLPPETLAVPLSMLRGALAALGGQQATAMPQAVPAGPVTGGVA